MQNESSIGYGTIFVVATPIGHLDDISKRAIDILKSVDLIIAEDTRHSKKLLQAYQINKPLLALHAHNEQQKSKSILKQVMQGQSIALVSDAGTPLISDPGYLLIKLAREQGITVSPIPGACALIAALSAAGIPCQQFTFLGFLPHKTESKKKLLNDYLKQQITLACYESPHRLGNTLSIIQSICESDYQFTLAKELTKAFETIRYGNAHSHIKWLADDTNHIKGEFILLLPPVESEIEQDVLSMMEVLVSELPVKQAAQIGAKLTGISKNQLYQMALSLQKAP